jgi:hypothetical protein
MFVCCESCVWSGRGLCDELIIRPEESYRLWCVVECDLETSRMRRPWPALGCSATKKYYQHQISGSRLCLKVSKEEEAYFKTSQHRSKTRGKPEVRSPNAHSLTELLLLGKRIYLIRMSHEKVWTVLFYDKRIILCFHWPDVCINLKIEGWTKWVRIGYYWWIHRKIWKEFCYSIVVNPRINFVLFSTTLS